MFHFINREQELKFLDNKWKSKDAELIILYGRRRIGKTELLQHFIKDKRAFYFLGRMESNKETIRRFNLLLSEFFQDFELLRRSLSDWDEIFNYISKRAMQEKLIFVFDEFPFIIDRFPEIVSVLQDKWDNKLKETKIFLVLCGSSIGMMEKHTLSYKSPLYGRRTGQWQVNKFDISTLSKFFPNYNITDLILVYSCLDTIPGYMAKFEKEKGVWENIEKKILNKGEFLYEEIEILLREEFRDPSNYMSILSAIAGGLTTFNEIYSKTQLDKSLLSKYLFVLEKLDIIEKIIPITETYKTKLKARGALYYLKDNFFDFWFKFVYLNKQELEKGKTEAVLKKIKDSIEEYIGKKFENFAREMIPDLNILNISKIGRWWHKDKEIDIVALNEQKKEILFGECKWKDNVNAKKVLKELKEKTKKVQWHNEERKEIYALFAKSFKSKISQFDGKKVYCFDLGDFEKLIKK